MPSQDVGVMAVMVKAGSMSNRFIASMWHTGTCLDSRDTNSPHAATQHQTDEYAGLSKQRPRVKTLQCASRLLASPSLLQDTSRCQEGRRRYRDTAGFTKLKTGRAAASISVRLRGSYSRSSINRRRGSYCRPAKPVICR